MVILGLGGLQFLQPRPPVSVLSGDGPISDFVRVPERVETLLRDSCFDCHSNETRWPWYSRVAPLSWWIVRDVQNGLSNLDFSRWSTDPIIEPTPSQRLTWICSDMREGIMPLKSYLWAHPSARLSEEEQGVICEWTRRALDELPSGTP